MSNDLTPSSGNVPAWMRSRSTGASIGNVDASDLKPPRLKVLAGMSPEVMEGVPNASPGNFWLTILNANLGKAVIGTPILLRKSYALWDPLEKRAPLASATDGVNWDVPNQKFEVRFPNNPRAVTWDTKRTVAESGLGQFGSSNPGDPKSKPAATLTYNTLWLIDIPNAPRQLCVMTVSRTGIAPMRTFISTARAQGVDHYFQIYELIIVKKSGPTGDPYYLADYRYLRNIESEKDGEFTEALYKQYGTSGFVVDLHEEAEEKPAPQRYDSPKDDDQDIPF